MKFQPTLLRVQENPHQPLWLIFENSFRNGYQFAIDHLKTVECLLFFAASKKGSQ